MSYYIATHCTESVTKPGRVYYSSSMLHEAPTKRDLDWLRKHYSHVERVTAAYAHRWVKDGGNHSTYLYIGHDGRIHRASEEKG